MRKYWWLLILPALLLLLWWAFSRGDSPPIVHFSTVAQTGISSTVPTNGKIEPAEWSAARAQAGGVVMTVNVQRGQDVQAGQPLVTLDSLATESNLAGALAREQQAQSQLQILDQGGKAATVADLTDRIAAAQAAVQVAQRIYDSDMRLLASQAITKLQVDGDADTLARAKQNLEALQNQKRTAVTSSDRAVAEAQLRDARAAVALARHRAGQVVITAPMAGTVYQFDLKRGAYLDPGAQVALVGDLDRVKVLVDVDEPDLGRVELGMPVRITSDSRPGRIWWGKIDKLATQVVPLGARTVGQVSAIIDNPGHALLPGVSIAATIISKVVKQALVIPKAALRRLGNQDGVYQLTGKTIRWQTVTTGIADINNVQILSGLAKGDAVADRVIDPSDAEIKNGMNVRPVVN